MKKTFTQFIFETTVGAATQARKLNLKSDGHGGWYDSRGEFVAKTEGGKLKFYDKGRKVGEKDEPTQKKSAAPEIKKPKATGPVQQMAKRRADDDLAGAPLQKKKEDESGEEKDDLPLTIVFGRFNPPTVGHEKLLQQAKKTAAGGDLKIYPSRTQDPKKNPLDTDMKVSYMRQMFPDFEEEIINDPEMKSIFDVLTTANDNGYSSINLVVGADRQAEFESLAMKYNGDLYDFDEIRVISAGARDADAPGLEGMSASKLRKAAADDYFKTFRRGIPKKMNDGEAQAVFDAVKRGMGGKAKKKTTEESYKLWEIAPRLDHKGLRDHYVKEEIFNLGDTVQHLNTGLVGEVIRRGTNHLICVTKEEYMFKGWIRDIMEYNYNEQTQKYGNDSMYRAPGKPNTLVGTKGYLKYAQSMVPGSEWGRQFINKYRKNK